MQYPLVTIVAVSYNQEAFVIDSLNSIRNQTYPNIQLIIADDGSKDNTKALIREWVKNEYPQALFLDHAVNQGVTKNLNSALPYIKGEYYQFLGCEDEMLPDKIATQVKLLQDNPGYSIVYSDMLRMSPEGVIEDQTHYQSKTYNVPHSGNVYKYLIERCFIATPSALMKTEVLNTVGGDNEALEINDHDFWMRASKDFLFLYHPNVTMKYRIMPESLSNRKGIIVYKNRFLLYYLNYNSSKEYKHLFDERLLFSAKNLFALKYKKCASLFFKAFLKSGKLKLLELAIRSIPFLFKAQKQ